jgi:hypothetical protein
MRIMPQVYLSRSRARSVHGSVSAYLARSLSTYLFLSLSLPAPSSKTGLAMWTAVWMLTYCGGTTDKSTRTLRSNTGADQRIFRNSLYGREQALLLQPSYALATRSSPLVKTGNLELGEFSEFHLNSVAPDVLCVAPFVQYEQQGPSWFAPMARNMQRAESFVGNTQLLFPHDYMRGTSSSQGAASTKRPWQYFLLFFFSSLLSLDA